MNNTTSRVTTLTIGEELKDLRLKRHETQEMVAKSIGVAKSTICSYEKLDDFQVGGRRDNKNFANLASHFGLPEDYFISKPKIADSMETLDSPNQAIEQNISNGLVGYFENAIDNYHIDNFMNYNFIFEPLSKERLNEVFSFLSNLQVTLPKFRGEANIANFIEFANILTEYLDFLGTNMHSEDGQIFKRLRNIDTQQAQENAITFRSKLNEIYGLISNGGSFALFRA